MRLLCGAFEHYFMEEGNLNQGVGAGVLCIFLWGRGLGATGTLLPIPYTRPHSADFATLYYRLDGRRDSLTVSVLDSRSPAITFIMKFLASCYNMHQSIPAVPIAPPPPPPPGNPGAFPNVARPGGGAFAYLGLTPRNLTRGFETVE